MTLLIGSACTSCSLTGNPFTFRYVNRYVILFVMANNAQFQQTTGTSSTGESLSHYGYAFTSSTNVTLSLQNLGSTTINFVSYTINDTSGNYWQNQAWNAGPITPGAFYTANIAIGFGPSGCGAAARVNPSGSNAPLISSAAGVVPWWPFTSRRSCSVAC